MGTNNKRDNVIKERRCVTPGKVNIYRKIDGDTREKEWDFLKGCWKDKPTVKGRWDLRYSS